MWVVDVGVAFQDHLSGVLQGRERALAEVNWLNLELQSHSVMEMHFEPCQAPLGGASKGSGFQNSPWVRPGEGERHCDLSHTEPEPVCPRTHTRKRQGALSGCRVVKECGMAFTGLRI